MSDPLAAEAVRCPHCGAPPGQACRSYGGTTVMPHDQRRRHWENHPVDNSAEFTGTHTGSSTSKSQANRRMISHPAAGHKK